MPASSPHTQSRISERALQFSMKAKRTEAKPGSALHPDLGSNGTICPARPLADNDPNRFCSVDQYTEAAAGRTAATVTVLPDSADKYRSVRFWEEA